MMISITFAGEILDYQKAKEFYKNGQYQQAFELFKHFDQRSDLKPYANYYLVRSGILAKQFVALKDFDFNIISQNNQPFKKELITLQKAVYFFNGSDLKDDDLVVCAQYFLSVGNYSNAQLLLNALSIQNKQSDSVNYIQSAIFFGQGNKKRAREYLNKTAYSAQKLAKMALYYPDTAKYYQKLIKDFPAAQQSWEAAYWLFKQARGQKNTNSALKYLKFLEDNASEFYKDLARFEKGYIYYTLKKYQYALENFQKVAAGYYKPYALFWQAKTLEKQKYPQQSKAILEQLLKQYPFSYYSYRASNILQIVPEIDLNSITYQRKKRHKLPSRILKLISAEAFDDAFYEVDSFYHDQDDIWYAAARAFLAKEQYFYVIKLNKPLQDKYLGYPLAYIDIVKQEAAKYDLDKLLPLSVMREESHFKNDAVSWSDARGLMQLMRPTAAEVAGKMKISNYHLDKPSDNIKLGTFYLDYLIKRFGLIKGVMAYNCGPGNLSRNDTSEEIDEFIENFPLAETRRYIKKVMASYWTYQLLYNNI